MKSISKLICMIGLAGLAAAGNAQVYTFISEIDQANQSIPDNSDVPSVFTINTQWWNDQVNTMEGTVDTTNSFRVYLDLEGDSSAINGDLLVTLKAPSGELAVLVNRPGRGISAGGYNDNGLNITLFDGIDPNDSSITDIHWYREDPLYNPLSETAITGTYKSDGRSIETTDEQQSLYMSAARDKTMAVFEGINPNGTWYLAVADLGAQGSVALKSWGLDFTPIPEPSQYAMVVGAGLMAFGFYRNRMRKTA